MRLSILIFFLSVYLLVAADFEEYRQSDEEDGEEEELRSIGSSSSSSSSESDENCSDGDGNCKKTVIVVEPKRRPAARPRPSTSSPPTRRPPAPAAPAPAPAQFSSPCPGASPKDLCPGERAALRAAWIQFMAEVEDAKRAAPGLEGQWQSAIIENLVLLNAEQTRGLNGDVQGPEEGHTNNLGGGAQQVQPITSNGQQANQPERELQPAGQFDLGQPGEAPSGSGLFREKRQQNGGSSQQGDAAVTCQEFTFDSRQKWPQCASVIGNIRDQSLCGDCWAVSASSSFSDRRCIQRAKQGQPIDPSEDNFFSAYDTAVCSDGAGGDDACKGGSTAKAWRWYTNTGVVTGGGNNQNGTCRPYPFPPTAQADQTIYQAPLSECTARCVSSNLEARYNSDKAMARNWNYLYGTNGWEEAMRNEIFNNGPISASLVVFEDFKTYSGGVYSHVTGNQLGGHAIRLIGYGNISCSNGLTQKYWLGANSWNVDWGLGGFFKIVRGVNMCEIESRQISYGMPTT